MSVLDSIMVDQEEAEVPSLRILSLFQEEETLIFFIGRGGNGASAKNYTSGGQNVSDSSLSRDGGDSYLLFGGGGKGRLPGAS